MRAGGDEEAADAPPGWIVRAWPCVVVSIEPFLTNDLRATSCAVRLADPVSYLAPRPVWGAYRGVSVGSMIGGALSMAAGGDGRPTLTPALPGLFVLDLRDDTREALERVPYSIATGQTLGGWLADMAGLLGLRLEMLGNALGHIQLTITDKRAGVGRRAIPMKVGPSDAPNNLQIIGVAAYPVPPSRGGLLDDPTLGSFRYLLRMGAVGNVLTGTEVGSDEAVERLLFERQTARSEMLMLNVETRQPGNRPGRLVALTPTFMGIDTWQVSRVVHVVAGNTYLNQTVLLPADTSWHPLPPPPRPPRVVSGMVDAGTDYIGQEPVARDRLGRVPVSFAFAPTPVGLEALALETADTNQDQRITLDDFTEEEIAKFNANAAWDQRVDSYHKGGYDDPYPGREDEDLDEEELYRRNQMRGYREEVIKYLLYQQAKELDTLDTDRDSYVTSRDEAISDELQALLDDPEKKKNLEAWAASHREGGVEALRKDFPDNFEDVAAHLGEIIEYNAAFHGFVDTEDAAGGEGETETTDTAGGDDKTSKLPTEEELKEDLDAYRDAELADEQWPPRIPLAVVAPMAGTVHGFIQAHRQGDICRVAVHHPLYAEIAGFQYRSNRQINAALASATTGFVVEHNMKEGWSGVLFRRASELEGDSADTDAE